MGMKEKLKNINENSYNNFMLKIGKYSKCYLRIHTYMIIDKIRAMSGYVHAKTFHCNVFFSYLEIFNVARQATAYTPALFRSKLKYFKNYLASYKITKLLIGTCKKYINHGEF